MKSLHVKTSVGYGFGQVCIRSVWLAPPAVIIPTDTVKPFKQLDSFRLPCRKEMKTEKSKKVRRRKLWVEIYMNPDWTKHLDPDPALICKTNISETGSG